MATTIKLKSGSGAPTSGQLVAAEPAFDLTNKRLYTEDSGGTVIEVGSNPTSLTTPTINNSTGVSLQYNGSTKAATTSTGIDVTGTVTADGLTVDGNATIGSGGSGAANVSITLNGSDAGTYGTVIQGKRNGTNQYILGDIAGIVGSGNGMASWVYSSNPYYVYTGNTKSLEVAGNGDISFYEDTGTTAKFFWDASAESLGIGQGVYSTTHALNLKGEGLAIKNDKNGSDNNWSTINNTDTGSSSNLSFSTGGKVDAVVFSHAGNVGIGTSSPSKQLEVQNGTAGTSVRVSNSGGGYADLSISSNATSTAALAFTNSLAITGGNVGIGTSSPSKTLEVYADNASTTAVTGIEVANFSSTTNARSGITFRNYDNYGASIWSPRTGSTTGALVFGTNSGAGTAETNIAERARIDSSGNLLVGKTSANSNLEGCELRSGFAVFTSNANVAAIYNRKTSDGTIQEFQKDGTTVGSIGANAGFLTVNSGDIGLLFNATDERIYATNGATGVKPNAVDLGDPTVPFKDLYLSGGVYLGGTGAANHLDDYETGTWTPTVYGLTTSGTATYTNQVATYTKVGNLCYVQCYIDYTSFTGTGEMRVAGLPFAGEAGAYEVHSGTIILDSITLPANTAYVSARAQDGQTFIRLVTTMDNATASSVVQCDAAGVITVGLTYRTA